jgi:hypothetical protein
MRNRIRQWGVGAMLVLTLLLGCMTDCQHTAVAHDRSGADILITRISPNTLSGDPGGHGG